jgi:HSP20 family protein
MTFTKGYISEFPNWLEFDRWDDFYKSGIEDRPANKYIWDETDNEYKIYVVMPGIDKKNIDVKFKNETLTIKCDKTLSEKEKQFYGVKTEQSFRNFPKGIDADKISAEMENGVLAINLPKREVDNPKSIEIK